MIKLIEFHADWCSPCQTMKLIVADLEKSLAGKVEFSQVNVDTQMEIAQKYSIMSIPTFVLEKEGIEVGRKTGAISREAMEIWLNSYL